MSSNNLSQNILNSLNIIRTDVNNKIIYVSPGMCQLTGYSENELLGKNPSIFRHPSAKSILFENVWDHLNKNGHWNGIFKNIKKDGTSYFQNTNISKEFDENNNHIGYFAIATEISKTIENPYEFIFESNFFDLFFSSTQELGAVALCDIDINLQAKLLDVTLPLTKMLNTTKEHILKNNLSFVDILSKDSKYYKNPDKLKNDYQFDKNVIIEFDTFDPAKKKYFCKLDIIKFKYHNKLMKFFKLTDVTKEIEMNKKLKELDQAKNEFLANFSHEIRTPLNAILGFLELMKNYTTDSTLLKYINIVIDNNKHLLEMMNNVINFMSYENNKIKIIPREFSPKDIQSAIEIFYAKSLEKNIDFNIYISPQLPEKMTQDILRIKQIIYNLLSNAFKFTDFGGKIIIDVFHDKKNLYIIVEDNGIGMTNEQISKIFNPFQQASDDTEIKYGGNGLGLAIVKKLIEKMGGDIYVESRKDFGTRFKLNIPLINLIEKKSLIKLDINKIYVYVPSFSIDKLTILRRYLTHFTNADIIRINNILPLTVDEKDIIILFKDDVDIKKIEKLIQTNKVILLKKFNDVGISDSIKKINLQEIDLPLLGSKLYNALYSLVYDNKNKSLIEPYVKSIFNSNLKLTGKILIAEDMHTNILLLENIFNKFPNLTYKIVNNGQDVLNEYKLSIVENKSFYDIIFLDENMPDLNGSEVAQKIREYEKINELKRIPLVAFTANRYGNKNNEYLLNMDEYLPKPINFEELFSIILKYTNKNIYISTSKSKQDKIQELKKIRDSFINHDENIFEKIDKLSCIIKSSDISELKKIVKLNDKTSFNKLYNKLIKNIRQENSLTSSIHTKDKITTHI